MIAKKVYYSPNSCVSIDEKKRAIIDITPNKVPLDDSLIIVSCSDNLDTYCNCNKKSFKPSSKYGLLYSNDNYHVLYIHINDLINEQPINHNNYISLAENIECIFQTGKSLKVANIVLDNVLFKLSSEILLIINLYCVKYISFFKKIIFIEKNEKNFVKFGKNFRFLLDNKN